MTLPVSGNTISFSQINTELIRASSNTITISDGEVRTLATYISALGGDSVTQSPSSVIKFSHLQGKSRRHELTISSAQNVNLRSLAISNGWNGLGKLVVTISGIITSTSTSTAALTIAGSFPNGVELINNGTIVGRGGAGGTGTSGGRSGSNGGNGGPAISVSVPVTINNNGIIGGGGGGGGGGGSYALKGMTNGGGGGGGGAGYGSGGAGGYGIMGGGTPSTGGTGAAGGLTTGGSGGGPGYGNNDGNGYGKTGGSLGAAGASGGGYGYLAGGTNSSSGLYGGAGGAAVLINSGGVVTWGTTGTRYGSYT